ncbi:hypothetical protein W97_01112 [Coniosporium apollinis CBS 100218]|uniref:Major facilitator superfamily (MFS) profile domain-containing protein n=1 Tax=Coniosporium apollinis (strain CBS 100218) TaxID=1168221 RepID=R7YJA9_CONA1|nr:uncharacterized protein W97_01112 [Coniosporium apollinis CBS 100218]EON61894.1 hypothetical protein W97_01112 [Coniosporium apollinis CBS 100218]
MAMSEMSPTEATAFNSLLFPNDSYDHGIYWADLSFGDRINFIRSVDSVERRQESSAIKREFLVSCEGWNGPLAWIGWIRGFFKLFAWYCETAVLPGAGLGLEGRVQSSPVLQSGTLTARNDTDLTTSYVLFSIGNIKPLLQSAFPRCWKDNEICNLTWLHAIEYLEVVGIIFGQIVVGFIGDWVGRRWGLIQDAGIMFVGLLMLTAAWGVTQNSWIVFYAWALFFYGIGVGGEYPMTATFGMESAVGSGKVSTREDRLHRGRKVTSAFLMQGWGQFWNVIILIIMLYITQRSGNPPYSQAAVQWTYRVSFFIPALGTGWLVWYRAYRMKFASRDLTAAKKKANVTGYDTQSLKLTCKYFGSRLVATAGTWFMNDVFFYGNKLFQNQFIEVLTTGNKSVMTTWKYNLINVAVSLAGYYLASFFIDNKLYGRKWMMIVGFMCDFVLFMVPAFAFDFFTSKNHIHAFQAMYFLSSFFNQFGPNSVTFLVAAEVFPTQVRATAHGFAAAIGKLGALVAAIIYNKISTQSIFYVVPWFGLAGAILTLVFLPDTTGLDLKEQERRWSYIREGREQDYHGIAIHPKHLSVWERLRGVGERYNSSADYEQRVEEMRGDWENWQARKAEEKLKDEDSEAEEDPGFPEEVSNYFHRTAANAATGRQDQSSDSYEEKNKNIQIQSSSGTSSTER